MDRAYIVFGLRFSVADDELESIEDRSHPLVVRSRQVGLHAVLTRLTEGEPYVLLVGLDLGQVGPSERSSFSLSLADTRLQKTAEKLERAGFHERPSLFVEYEAGA